MSVAKLPTGAGSVKAAKAVSSVSGQGAIVQHWENLYQLKYKNNKYAWTTLPQKLNPGVTRAVIMTLPDDYTC